MIAREHKKLISHRFYGNHKLNKLVCIFTCVPYEYERFYERMFLIAILCFSIHKKNLFVKLGIIKK